MGRTGLEPLRERRQESRFHRPRRRVPVSLVTEQVSVTVELLRHRERGATDTRTKNGEATPLGNEANRPRPAPLRRAYGFSTDFPRVSPAAVHAELAARFGVEEEDPCDWYPRHELV